MITLTKSKWEPRKDFGKLEGKLGYAFKNPQLLHQALTPRGTDPENNMEVMELVGDSALAFAVLHLLCERYPKANEAQLTTRKNVLVSNSTLTHVALRIDVLPYMRLPQSHPDVGHKRLADVIEALSYAIVQDGGFTGLLRVLRRLLRTELELCQMENPELILRRYLLKHRKNVLYYVAPKPRHPDLSIHQGYVCTVFVEPFGADSSNHRSRRERMLPLRGEHYSSGGAIKTACALANLSLQPELFPTKLDLQHFSWTLRPIARKRLLELQTNKGGL